MGSPIPLWIPCEVFDVVLSADDMGPTAMEKALLLFLAGRGKAKLPDVLSFLCLGERMAMDLVTGLWTAGYVLVDANQGSVSLEPFWARKVEEAKKVEEGWKSILSGQRISHTASLMRDLVSGQIVADISSPATPQPRSAGPILVASSLAEGVTQAQLAAIAMRTLWHGSPLRSNSRKVRAEIVGGGASAPGGARSIGWLRMEFEATVDRYLEGSLILRTASSDGTRNRIGPRIAKALTAWALDNRDHPVVADLIGAAGLETRSHSASLTGRIETLAARITAGMAAPKDHRAEADRWRGEIAGLKSEVDALETTRGKVVLHTGEAAAPNAVLRLAADFKHQLVLAAPSIDYEGVLNLGDTVVSRLKTLPVDASAVVLWGGINQLRIPGRGVSNLDHVGSDTAVEGAQRFLCVPRPSRIAAALAVIDGRRVLYASASPLLAATSGDEVGAASRETFAYVLDITAEPPSPIPRRALEIARERAPDFTIVEQIDLKPWIEEVLWSPEPLDAPGVGKADDEGDDESEAEEDAVGMGGSGADAEHADQERAAEANEAISLKAAFHDLRQICRDLAARTARTGPTVEILADGALYQQALDLAADEARLSQEDTLWLGFGRDETAPSGTPLHRTLAEAVGERARRGLPTVVLIAPPPPATPASGGDKKDRAAGGIDIASLRELAGQFPDLVAIHETPGLTGHFLCGEARFLAAPGGLASPPVAQAGRLARRLVGVAVADSDLCADFRAALAASWPKLKLHLSNASHHKSTAAAAPPVVAVANLVEAWRVAGHGHRRTALRAAMEARRTDGDIDGDARALLDLTADSGDQPARNLRRDTLALAAAFGGETLAQAALGELAADAWRGRRWQEAAVILTAGAVDSALCPVPAELAAAAAAVDVGLIAPDISLLLGREDDDGWLAGVALAGKAVLFNGDQDMASSLAIKLLDAVPPAGEPLRAVAQGILDHWEATMKSVDPATILAIARKDDLEANLRSAARAFAESFHSAAQHKHGHRMFTRVVPRIYSDVSGFSPVVKLIAETGATASWPAVLKGLTAAIGEGRVNVVELADEFFETSRQLFGTGLDEKIVKGRGKGAGVHEAAYEVIRRAVGLRDAIQGAQGAPDRAAGPPMLSLLAILRAHRPALAALAAAQPPSAIAGPIVTDLHDRLADMTEIRP